jgi:hypothetical protein
MPDKSAHQMAVAVPPPQALRMAQAVAGGAPNVAETAPATDIDIDKLQQLLVAKGVRTTHRTPHITYATVLEMWLLTNGPYVGRKKAGVEGAGDGQHSSSLRVRSFLSSI